jgi:hypothetical protein
MSKPAGGRGKKAPYETTHVRVPEPIKAEVKRMIDRFYDSEVETDLNLETSLSAAVVLAESILSQKKSARVSMEKLLTALYHREIKLYLLK